MNATRAFHLLAFLVPSVAVAQTGNCGLVDQIAATSYDRAVDAMQRKWVEAARSAAYFFWYVHDLGDCQLTKAMGVHMTNNNLGRGTEPTGPSSASKFQASLTLPSTTKFAQVAGNYEKGVFAPETVVVNGLTYRLEGAQAGGVLTHQAIDAFLKDHEKRELGGVAADRALLKQWADLPVTPGVVKDKGGIANMR